MDYCNETLQLKTGIEKGFLLMGERLHNIRDNKLYSPEWDSFNEYLMEFGNMSPATASKLINIYLKFIKEFGFTETKLLEAKGWTNLSKIVSVSNSKEEAEEWLIKASVLTSRDLDREIYEHINGTDMIKCEHTSEELMLLHICDNCGDKYTTPYEEKA